MSDAAARQKATGVTHKPRPRPDSQENGSGSRGARGSRFRTDDNEDDIIDVTDSSSSSFWGDPSGIVKDDVRTEQTVSDIPDAGEKAKTTKRKKDGRLSKLAERAAADEKKFSNEIPEAAWQTGEIDAHTAAQMKVGSPLSAKVHSFCATPLFK